MKLRLRLKVLTCDGFPKLPSPLLVAAEVRHNSMFILVTFASVIYMHVSCSMFDWSAFFNRLDCTNRVPSRIQIYVHVATLCSKVNFRNTSYFKLLFT